MDHSACSAPSIDHDHTIPTDIDDSFVQDVRRALIETAAANGWKLIQLEHNSKQPAPGISWKKAATTDPDVVASWPADCNLGIVAGDGLFVLDIDRQGTAADAILKELGFDGMPRTPTVLTPRGLHFYFKTDADLSISAGQLAEHADTRAGGKGYVVAPGSSIGATAYMWADGLSPGDVELAELPARIVEWMRKPKAERRQPVAPNPAIQVSDRYLHTALERETESVRNADKGTHNDQLNRSAYSLGQLVDAGLDRSAIEIELGTAAEAAGLEAEEIAGTLRSGLEKGMATPRSIPQRAAPPTPTDDGGSAKPAPGRRPQFTRSDSGNADRLVRALNGSARHVAKWGTWLIWRGTHWAKDETNQMRRQARDVIRAMWEEVPQLDDPEDKKKFEKFITRSENAARLSGMLEVASADQAIATRHDVFDTNPWLLNVQNGVVDLRTGQLREHSSNDLVTKYVDVPFDPDANCTRFEQFLLEIFNDDVELALYVQQAIGYSLTGSTREQCFFLLHGMGANGKSVLVETLLGLLGDYSQTAPFETFLAKKFDGGVPTDIARMRGARLVVAQESDAGKRLNEQTIKTLTSGDRIAARFMRQDFFEFKPELKLWLATNHRPNIRGTDHAIWRRVKLIPFERTFAPHEQAPDLLSKLQGELPGILAWAIQGAMQWLEHGLTDSGRVRAATAAYKAEEDLLGESLEACCMVGPNLSVSSHDLYERYKQWTDEQGLKTMSQRGLASALQDRDEDFENGKAAHVRVWKGLELTARGDRCAGEGASNRWAS